MPLFLLIAIKIIFVQSLNNRTEIKLWFRAQIAASVFVNPRALLEGGRRRNSGNFANKLRDKNAE